MKVSIAIQTHPRRAEMASELLGKLAGRAELVVDPDPDGRPSPWRTYRQALERAAETGADHVLVIQDDVEPCAHLPEAIDRAVEQGPDGLLVFFVAGRPAQYRRAVMDACRHDQPWARLRVDTWVPAVATCWPVELVEPFLAFVDAQRWPATFTADDEIIGRFVRQRSVDVFASVPSLVEHPDVTPSLAGRRVVDGRDPGRKAACWIGDCDECDARLIDWTVGPA